MTWLEANLSLQLAAEERVGWIMRKTAQDARDREDAAFASMASQAGRTP